MFLSGPSIYVEITRCRDKRGRDNGVRLYYIYITHEFIDNKIYTYISIVNILIHSYTLTIQKHKTIPFKIPSQDKPWQIHVTNQEITTQPNNEYHPNILIKLSWWELKLVQRHDIKDKNWHNIEDKNHTKLKQNYPSKQ